MTKPPTATYTVVTCHYGDLFWIRHMLSQLGKFSDGRLKEVIVVDQSRSMHKELSELPLVSKVLTFQPDKEQLAIEGHDHPAALDNALRSHRFSSTHILVMDSDAFPIRGDWWERLENISLALVPGSSKNTHPCLMVFPVDLAQHVSFSEGYLDRAEGSGPDTGRRVGSQLIATGEAVSLLEPKPAFNGYRGSFYLEGAYYHHGHGSFLAGDHDQYKGFVSQASEKLYRKKVIQGKFTLSLGNLGGLMVRYMWRRLSNRIRLFLRGPSSKPQ